MQQVAAILVNYNTVNDTIRCVQSIAKQTLLPNFVIIVDNSPNKESYSKFLSLKESCSSFKILFIFNKKNYGFATACNQAIKLLLKENFNGFYWLINNDTEAEPEALLKLLEKAEKTQAAITGSKILLNGNKTGGIAKVNSILGSIKRISKFTNSKGEYIEGSSMLISQKCLDILGYLPEDYFLYFEETDYCFKAKEAGLTLAWAEESLIYHNAGNSTGSEKGKGQTPFFIDCLMIRNRYIFSKKHSFPILGIFIAFCCSFFLRLKRKQINRIFTIAKIVISERAFKDFIQKNGGAFI